MQFFKILLMASFALLPLAGSAQDVVYSKYDKFDYRDDEYNVVGIVGGQLFTYRSTSDGAMLESYDDSMNKVAVIMLDFFPARIYQTRFIAYPDKMIVLYQALESNKVVQYAAHLDSKGMLIGKPVELGSFKVGLFGATKTYFQSAVSENKKSIVVYSVSDKGGDISMDAKWLDDNGTIVKRSRGVFKAENEIQHGEVNVSNDGTVYMAAYTPDGAMNYADQYWILSLAPGATKFVPKELQLNDKYAASGYMKIDNVNQKIYFGGFYSDKKNGGYNGVIYAAYDIPTATFLTQKFLPLQSDLSGANSARRRNRAFDNYQPRQLIVKNDGGFVMVSEIAFVTTRSNFVPGMGYYSFYTPYMSTMVHEYHYDDIMAISYNKDAVKEWSAFIPKEQYSQEDGGVFSSYALLNTGGTLAFLYNDFNSARSRIQMATIDPDGKTEMHSFTAEGNDNPDWLPRSGKQVASHVLVVPCFHRKQICFARVTF